MRALLSHSVTTKLQKLFWVYVTRNGTISSLQDFRIVPPATACLILPITPDNCHRVQEFREQTRVAEYRAKLADNQIGMFAECEGEVVGSIWASVNKTGAPITVRGYMPLLPNEALMHDAVTAERMRGKGIGPYMVGTIAKALLADHGVHRIIMDVNVRNASSLRMLAKIGVRTTETVLYCSVLGGLLFQATLRRDSE